jgi:acyl carrier protein
MDVEEIKAAVRMIVSDMVASNGNGTMVDIADDDSLIDGGVIDSVSTIQIIEALSERFDIVFHPAELSLDNFDAIDKISSFIQGKLIGADA